jgi:hypothetical protein
MEKYVASFFPVYLHCTPKWIYLPNGFFFFEAPPHKNEGHLERKEMPPLAKKDVPTMNEGARRKKVQPTIGPLISD